MGEQAEPFLGGVRFLGLNSSRFLSAFKVKEINVVFFFSKQILYKSFGNVLSYYSFYAWIKYVLHEKYVRSLYFFYNREMWRYYVLKI